MIYTDKIHLVADTLIELQDFAIKIGLKSHFYHGLRKGHPHYDLTNPKILNKALDNGAKIVDKREILRISKNMLVKQEEHRYKDPCVARLRLGEAHMFCADCMCKLYSFDGHMDMVTSCPTPIECERKRN